MNAAMQKIWNFFSSISAEIWLSAALAAVFIIAIIWLALLYARLRRKARDDFSWQRNVNDLQKWKAEAESELAAKNAVLSETGRQIAQDEETLRKAQRQCGFETELSDEDFVTWLRKRETAEKIEAEQEIAEKRRKSVLAKAEALREKLAAYNDGMPFALPGSDFLSLTQKAQTEAERQLRLREKLRHEESAEQKLRENLAVKEQQLIHLNEQAENVELAFTAAIKAYLGDEVSPALVRQNLKTLDRIAVFAAQATKAADNMQIQRAELSEKIRLLPRDDENDNSITALNAESLMAEAEQERIRIEEQYDSASKQQAALEQELRGITGNDSLALLAQEQETIALEMQETARNYARLHFGFELAAEAMRHYRDAHRGGMMEEAERAFKALTNGAYQSLQTRQESGNEILAAVSKDGAIKRAEDMSKGTRFQLYMALRAAAYKQLQDKDINLPFFCDDVFETFDNERTRSACCLMQHIGLQGQAIYFTHHLHVVEIAREICGDNVQIHEI